MIEWLLGAAKIYIIGVGVFITAVTSIVIWLSISTLCDMRKMEREMDRKRSRFP